MQEQIIKQICPRCGNERVLNNEELEFKNITESLGISYAGICQPCKTKMRLARHSNEKVIQ